MPRAVKIIFGKICQEKAETFKLSKHIRNVSFFLRKDRYQNCDTPFAIFHLFWKNQFQESLKQSDNTSLIIGDAIFKIKLLFQIHIATRSKVDVLTETEKTSSTKVSSNNFPIFLMKSSMILSQIFNDVINVHSPSRNTGRFCSLQKCMHAKLLIKHGKFRQQASKNLQNIHTTWKSLEVFNKTLLSAFRQHNISNDSSIQLL